MGEPLATGVGSWWRWRDTVRTHESARVGCGELIPPPSPSAPFPQDGEVGDQGPEESASSSGNLPSNIFTMVCEACQGGHSEDKIILCDRCDKGWHLFCLQPVLEAVPVGDWICPVCIERGAVQWIGGSVNSACLPYCAGVVFRGRILLPLPLAFFVRAPD